MPAGGTKKQLHLGFLSAVEVKDRGYVGGLLVTNHFGRPLEFQCTAPVRPNHTQEVLFGPTLVPYLYNELIGKTLIEKIGVKPDLVLTDDERVLGLRDHVDRPIGFLQEEANAGPDSLPLGLQKISFHERHPTDRDVLYELGNLVSHETDLFEPFERVKQALQEALQQVKQRA
ncbi:hypothetical protein Pla110_28180 [Polystyrenella longa]|uniref:Uncharacterized protein n=1 Tax=Polystyrenella longa TaxID=2528007 RepID=A0A518CPD7_9PLAN|nr:hypothetical protein [Polystyrenella longa]QDU81081.1 hypothetical protein Pla110_28180 [Polystyrenella longa]